jgi:hypothetical protein
MNADVLRLTMLTNAGPTLAVVESVPGPEPYFRASAPDYPGIVAEAMTAPLATVKLAAVAAFYLYQRASA